MTKEKRQVGETELFRLGLDASTAVKCADFLSKGLNVDNQRLETGKNFVGKEVGKARIGLLYEKSPNVPSRLLETHSTIDEALDQDRALKRVREAFSLWNNPVGEKLDLLNEWSNGVFGDETNEAAFTFSSYVVQEAKYLLVAPDS